MLMALALMFSCRTENMDENNLQKNLEKTSQAKFITKTVSLSGKDEIVKRSNILHAFKNNKTNTAELDYKHVEYIETVGKKTYTFKILNSDAPGSFQNLVIIQYPDGTIKKKIITYSASENEKQSMLMGNMVNFSGKVISVTDLDDAAPNNTQGKYYESGGKCYSESIEVSPCGSGQHNASNMDQWDKCTHPVKAKLIVTVEEVPCGSGGSSSTGTGTDYGNDTQNPDNGGIDFPTAPTLTNLQFILFVNTLPQNLQDVVNNVDYLDFYTGLNNYFYYSNKTAAAKAFITWALQFKLANPDTSWDQFQKWFINGQLNYQNSSDVEFAGNLSALSHDLLIANQNNTLNQLQANWPNWEKIKQNIKNSIAQGVHQTAKVVKTYYDEVIDDPYINNAATRVVLNAYIDALRNEIKQTTNMNKDTMKWQDLFNIWLFELMPNPYSSISFTWDSNVINGNTLYNASTNAVYTFPKGDYEDPVTHNKTPLINKLKASLSNNSIGVGSILNGYFKYDFAQYYATLSNQNIGIQMLGSYPVDAKIISKVNGVAVVQFYIYNVLGWDSATRFVQTSNGTIGFIHNKEIGEGLHLGGNLKNNYTWQETIIY